MLLVSVPLLAKPPGLAKQGKTPAGFSQGEKTGWQGESSPPGWNKPEGKWEDDEELMSDEMEENKPTSKGEKKAKKVKKAKKIKRAKKVKKFKKAKGRKK